MVLESLQRKGWVRIYSGVPLLFKAAEPAAVFEKVKEDYTRLLESVQTTLKNEVNNMKEKFVIKKFDIGLEGLKQELKKAKTVEINNATTDFVKKISDAFGNDAVVRVLMFPDEEKTSNLPRVEFKQAEVAIVSIVRNREVPPCPLYLMRTERSRLSRTQLTTSTSSTKCSMTSANGASANGVA